MCDRKERRKPKGLCEIVQTTTTKIKQQNKIPVTFILLICQGDSTVLAGRRRHLNRGTAGNSTSTTQQHLAFGSPLTAGSDADVPGLGSPQPLVLTWTGFLQILPGERAQSPSPGDSILDFYSAYILGTSRAVVS